MSSAQRPGLIVSARKWWCGEAARHGRTATARRLFAELWSVLRLSIPQQRRRLYGDVDYDWDHRVNTTGATVSFRNRLLGIFHSPYQPTEPSLFHEMIESLNLDHERFLFLDLGSGKGRALLMASDYPFRRIAGVELLPELHAVAEENIRRYKSGAQKCARIETICGDAHKYTFPDDPLLVYLFNPFPEAILERVISHLEDSVNRNPRPVVILCHSLPAQHWMGKSTVFRKEGGTHQYAIYSNA
jgi:SAM-dependent methyltransferase